MSNIVYKHSNWIDKLNDFEESVKNLFVVLFTVAFHLIMLGIVLLVIAAIVIWAWHMVLG